MRKEGCDRGLFYVEGQKNTIMVAGMVGLHLYRPNLSHHVVENIMSAKAADVLC